MNVADFLSPANAIVETRALDKSRLLTELAEKAARTVGLDAQAVTAGILAREELGSTGMGGGIAIPHARLPGIDRPVGLLARLKRAVDFAAIDGAPVDVVFLLLLSDKPKDEQLSALACVARTLRNPQTLAGLRQAETGAELYAAVADGGDAMKAAAG